ncbi:hypothetical protein K1W54_02580 [Micromonospora sp. CPCC 205371]|nr:hypothetical protein [Micromonospora sp. CPCC 205371]
MRGWVHVGRLWTNGEPFLAMDAVLREGWRGGSDEDLYEVRIVGLGPEVTSIPVGAGAAVLVGGDGVVRDDSWMEVLEANDGALAIVQAAGAEYPHVIAQALDYPDRGDIDGGTLRVESGELAIFSAAVDGVDPLLPARSGPMPTAHGWPTGQADPGLLIPARHRTYRLAVRWYTELPDDGCFARWLLLPGG